ncbi:MAG: ABC transporter transmembrane domain-containing protein [Lysobacterales bacterium]
MDKDAPTRTRSLLRQIQPFVKPHWRLVFGWTVFMLISTAATLYLPVAVRRMLNHGFEVADTVSMDTYFLRLFGIAAILALATAMRFYCSSMLGEAVAADLRRAIFTHLLRLDAVFFENHRTGALLSRLTADTELIQSVVGAGASVALRNSLLVIGASIALILTIPKLAGIAALVIPIALLPMYLFGGRVRVLSRESQDRIGDASAQAAESLGAVRTLQANTLEVEESTRFDGAIERGLATARQRIRARGWQTMLMIFVVFGAITLVLWIGANDVSQGRLTPGRLGQFLLYAAAAAGAATTLTDVWGEIQRAAGAMDRIGQLLASRSTIRQIAIPEPLPRPARGEVRFEQVGFHYPSRPDQNALDDFNLHIRHGETIALVGPSGAGKSTVFQLLLRFYDPQAGRVLIDGVDIAKLSLHDLRRSIALVPQDSVIFAASAMENIRFGRYDASDAEVIAAARAAYAHEFIERQPAGYDTDLGERGVRLSGGQQQRIAIARAILRDAPILLLDEATSALDAQSEAAIQKALEHVMRDRTTLIIAHRLATVQKADRIVVVDHGRIQAIGSHEQLIAADGLYAHLARLQFAS